MTWKTVKLGEVCTIERNGIEAKAISSGTLYVGLEHIEKNGEFGNIQTVANGDLASTKFSFGPQHILYGKLRPYLSKIARPHFIGVCSTDILPVLPGQKVNRNFLFHYLRLPDMIELARSRSSGANLPRLSPRALAEFEIPLPSLDEQKRIASILDAADQLRARRRESLLRLDALAHSFFLDAFGDPATNPKGWEMIPLKYAASKEKNAIRRGPFGGALKKEFFVESGYKVYEQGNVIYDDFQRGRYFISETMYKKLAMFSVQADDILISCSGTLGKVAIVPAQFQPGVINQALLKITIDSTKYLPLIFRMVFEHPSFQRNLIDSSHGSGIKNLKSVEVIKELQIPLPPLSHQQKFAERIAQLEAVRARMETSRRELDALFAALQARAFGGALSTENSMSS